MNKGNGVPSFVSNLRQNWRIWVILSTVLGILILFVLFRLFPVIVQQNDTSDANTLFEYTSSEQILPLFQSELKKWADDYLILKMEGFPPIQVKNQKTEYQTKEDGTFGSWLALGYSPSSQTILNLQWYKGKLTSSAGMKTSANTQSGITSENIHHSNVIYSKALESGVDASTNYMRFTLTSTSKLMWIVEERSRTEKENSNSAYSEGKLIKTLEFEAQKD